LLLRAAIQIAGRQYAGNPDVRATGNGAPRREGKSRRPVVDLDPIYRIHSSLGPPESTSQTACRSVQLFLHGSQSLQTDKQTDRPTDHATPSVAIGRFYLVLRCGLIVMTVTSATTVITTSGQSNWTKKAASPPHTDGSVVFARWRQYAPHLIHAHPSPHPKWHLSRFSRFWRLTTVTNRQTDRPRYSVCMDVSKGA